MNYNEYFNRLLSHKKSFSLNGKKKEFKVKNSRNHTQHITDGKIYYNFVIVSKKTRGTYGKNFEGFIVETYINGHLNTETYFNQLLMQRSNIENKLQNIELYWEQSPNSNKTFRVYAKFEADIEDESKWDMCIDWQINTMIKFLEVFPRYTQQLNIIDNSKPERNLEMRMKNIILYGAPGVGKTHNTNKLISLIEQGKTEKEILDTIKENSNETIILQDDLQPRVKFITFHQSFGYEDFIEGFRPNKEGNIKIEKGIFHNICTEAIKEENKDKNYYLVIDEINRGNISKIFGELITLIEDDKRDKIEVTLPYSKEPFKVPSNLFIIGTMNSTDKSIALIDIALRRRFTFLKMKPNEILVPDIAKSIFSQINQKISETIGEDYKIGHSYFMNISNEDDLNFVLEYKITPLLEEYFYGNKEQLDQVLEIIKG